MGTAWDTKKLPGHLKHNSHEMTTKLLITLSNPDIIPLDYKTWQDCLSTCELDGHAALHDVISSVHPALTTNHVETNTPSHETSETVSTCITRFME